MSSHLCLKWNNHSPSFTKYMKKIHFKEKYSDATIICEDKQYHVHRLILSTCSEYFEKLFEKISNQHPYIIFKDISKSEMDLLLNYMYQGEVNVEQDALPSLIKAAEVLKIKGLVVPDDFPANDDSTLGKRPASDDGSPRVKKKHSERQSRKSSDTHVSADVSDRNIGLANQFEGSHTLSNTDHIEKREIAAVKEEPFDCYEVLPYDNGDEVDEKCFSQNQEIFNSESSSNLDAESFNIQPDWHEFSSDSQAGPLTTGDPESNEFAKLMSLTTGEPGSDHLKPVISVPHHPVTSFSRRTWPFRREMGINGELQFTCMLCPHRCSHKGNIISHIKNKHLKERPFACSLCSYRFFYKADLKRHEMSHSHKQRTL